MVSCFKGAFRVTSVYGMRTLNGVTRFHHGLDLVGLEDIIVYAISAGTVRTGFQANEAGNFVVVTMKDGRRVYYMHLKSFLVPNGAFVAKGQAIGIMGNTGHSYGAHTHLELRPKGTSYESLDIAAFTGIPNKLGVYYYNPNEQEESAVTQEKFDEMMEDYLRRLAEKPPEEWSKEERDFCEKRAILRGDSDGKMRYKSYVTREEAAAIAYRIVKGLTEFGR
ncbi:MAG: M23 family metallopeptidase [Eubacteriales bacterium]|jgi:murein DD-endopeptidase MepM/ murein hydrolase activator NlpD